MRKTLLLITIMFSMLQTTYANTTGKITGGVNYEIPNWFKNSFLELAEDAQEAGKNNKHVMLFFHLDDCPYCARTINDLNANKSKISQAFDVIDINIKGDREIEINDTESITEREMAQKLKIQRTILIPPVHIGKLHHGLPMMMTMTDSNQNNL